MIDRLDFYPIMFDNHYCLLIRAVVLINKSFYFFFEKLNKFCISLRFLQGNSKLEGLVSC